MIFCRNFQLQRTLLGLARRCATAAGATDVKTSCEISTALRLAAAAAVDTPQPQQWHRNLSRSFAAQAAEEETEATDLTLTDAAVERLQALSAQTPGQAAVLRLTVEGGGCSGFTYLFDLDSHMNPDDRVVTRGDTSLVCDSVSYEFIRGATIDYVKELVRSAFEVTSNPNALQSCGCGSSFSPKS